MKYQVTITETLSRKISVDAPSAEMAEEQVRGLYREEEIVDLSEKPVETGH